MSGSDNQFQPLIDSVRKQTNAVENKMTQIDKKVEETLKVVPEYGRIFHVSTPNGSDANDGLTPSTALKTVQEAIQRTPRGGYCLVYLANSQEHNFAKDNVYSVILEDVGLKIRATSAFVGNHIENPGYDFGYREIDTPEVPILNVNCMVDCESSRISIGGYFRGVQVNQELAGVTTDRAKFRVRYESGGNYRGLFNTTLESAHSSFVCYDPLGFVSELFSNVRKAWIFAEAEGVNFYRTRLAGALTGDLIALKGTHAATSSIVDKSSITYSTENPTVPLNFTTNIKALVE